MTSTHLTIVGKGKKMLIQQLIGGSTLHPSLPTLSTYNKRMKINNAVFTYQKKFKPFTIFKQYQYNKKAFIFIDTTYDISIHSIQHYYEGLISKNKHLPNDIHIILYQNNTTIDLNIFHQIIQFCSFKQIKLININ